MKNIYKNKSGIRNTIWLFSLLGAFLIATLNLHAQTIQLGTGTTATANTTASPVNGYFNFMHYQTVYTAAEINLAGITGASSIDSLGYFVTAVPAGGLPNYEIRMANTSTANCAANVVATLSTVYTNAAPTWTAGSWNMLYFSSPFVWDGSSNILVDVVFGSAPFTTPYGSIYYYNATSGSRYIWCDACGSQANNPTTVTQGTKPQVKFHFTPLPACTTPPSAGNAISSAATVCPANSFNLSLQGASIASGLSYQWESSPDSLIWTPISGATSASYSTTQTAATYYHCLVTCGVSTVPSAGVFVNVNSFTTCYCGSAATTSADEEILNVTLASLNNSSTCATTGGPGSVLNRYSNFTNLSAATGVFPGMVLPFSVQVGTCGGNFASGTSIFIDYNQNGSYADAGEQVFTTPITTNGPHMVTGTFTVPPGATLGTTGMRVINAEGFSGTGITPCLSYGYGETEDYLVTISPPPADDAGLSAFIQPVTACAGTTDVEVRLVNLGTNALTSTLIEWSINSVVQTPFSFFGNVPTAGDTDVVIGSMTVATGNTYDILAWTSSPNNQTDGFNGNDTLAKLGLEEAMNGTYTIGDSTADYQSFNGAVADLISRGVCGPVIFNVDSSTSVGIYVETVSIPQIMGADTTNTITFNGNGDTLAFATTNFATQYIFQLNGADYVTVNNLVIKINPGGFYGFAMHITNGSTHNHITNCKMISHDINSTNTYGGIIISGSNSSVFAATTNAQYNVIDNNEVVGVYYGIISYGTFGSTTVKHNQFVNNIVRNAYAYNYYLYATDSSLFSGNNISRPTRTSVTTFYGFYIGGNSKANIFEKNRIHEPFGGVLTSTGVSYGIYATGVDAPIGSENIARNNLIYDMRHNGTTYGIYNTSSDGFHYYHNTISLDYTAATAGLTYGFYQTTLATNLDFRNNIITITRGGSGNKWCLYFNTATSTIISNYNDVFISSAGSGTQNIGYKNATSQATLANWLVTGHDSSSVSLDPIYSLPSNGNYTPLSPGVDSAATPVGVMDDILGAVRDTVAPDIGAYEFTPQPFDASVVSIVGPLQNNCYSSAEDIVVRVRNTGTVDLDFSINNLSIYAEISGTITQTLSAILTSNALNGGIPLPSLATVDVLVGNADLTAMGSYSINAYTTMAVDVLTSNDTLSNLYMLNVSPGNVSPDSINICNGGSTKLNLTGNTGALQWQSWDPNTLSWINESGLGYDSVVYTVSPSVATDYRALVCGVHSTDTVQVTVTTVPNPFSATGDTVCGIDTAYLSATGNGLKWYDADVNGTMLDTGATYNPFITATDTFYVSASSGGGLAAPLTTTFAAGNGSTGNMFDVTALNTITITGIDGHIGTGITANWEVWYRSGSFVGFESSNSGWTLAGSAAGVVSGGTGLPTPLPIALQITIPAGQTFGIYVTTTASTVNYTNGTAVGNVYVADQNMQFREGKGGSYFGVTIATRIWNGRIHYSAGCESARMPVIALSTTPPAAALNTSFTQICDGNNTTLSMSSANTNYSYTWNPSTGLSAGTGASVTASPATTTTYVVDAHDATLNCLLKDTVTVKVNPNPIVNTTVSDDTICAGMSVQLSAASPSMITIGTGTGVTTGTGESPFGTFYHDHRSQILYSAADLQAAGFFGGQVFSMAFHVPGVAATQVMTGFTISMKNTTTTAMTAWEGGIAQVYTGNYTAVGGWNTFTFTTPFLWDGTSNLLVQVCFDNSAYTSNTGVSYTTTPASSQYYGYSDSGFPNPCSSSTQTVTGTTTQRPNAQFGIINNYAYAWTPSIGLSDPTIADPIATIATNTDFTVIVTDTLTGCFATDSSLSVVVAGGFTVNLGADTSICSNSAFVLDPGAGFASYMWNDSTTNQTYTILPGTPATTISVIVTDGGGCSATDTVTIDMFPQPSVNLGADTTVCITDTLILNAGPGFTDYIWQDNSPAQTFTIPPGTASATYIVTVYDGNGCSATDTINVIIDSCVGINELSLIRDISIQPNPSRGIFNITNTGSELQDAMIEIRNLEGQLVYIEELNKIAKGFRKEVNLTNYAKGVYTIRITSSEGMYINRLIVQ